MSLESHIQTRALVDALNGVDDLLHGRNTKLVKSNERKSLAKNFSVKPYHKFFYAWAFTAKEYPTLLKKIKVLSPELVSKLVPPERPGDFTLVGHCELALKFKLVENGSMETKIVLQSGETVKAASIISERAFQYSNGVVCVPSRSGENIYFYSPTDDNNAFSSDLACKIFQTCNKIEIKKLQLSFPIAKTNTIPKYEWVWRLESENELYFVKNFINSGEAIVDENGFFAKETQIVQMKERGFVPEFTKVTINKPFLVFFADDSGVHASAWFNKDSFEMLEK